MSRIVSAFGECFFLSSSQRTLNTDTGLRSCRESQWLAVGIFLLAMLHSASAQSVTLSPTSLSFGNQAVGSSSSAKNITLKNSGTATLGISSIAASGDYSQTNTCGASLAASAKCIISVNFAPTALGSRTGTVTITDNASNSPQTVSLTGTGIAQTTVSPASLSFGNQAEGTSSAAKTVKLTNNLPTALSISSIGVTGNFAQTNTCGTSLSGGTNCTISVTFTPTALGSQTGTLTISDSATNSPQTVPLTGNGVIPVTVSPGTLAFGNEAVTITSTAKTVTVSNKQPTAVSISSITTPAAYAQTNTCGTLLAAQATCTVSVTFTPTTTGSQPGTLTITDSAANSPQTVNLTGTGTALPSITGLSITSGPVGTAVTITGANFAGSQGSSTVTFNGTPATPTSWKSTSIAVAVPAAATSGKVVVTVNNGPSNGVAFTVVPKIGSLSVPSGIAGTPVTITGSGFGSLQGSSTVSFNGTPSTPTSWSATSITAPVPTAANSGAGTVVVTVNGVASNGSAFTVVPNVLALSPNVGVIGSTVTINGTGFGPTAGSVTFNGTAATPSSWTAGSIVAAVPASASTGNVIVTANGVSSSGVNFTVAPNILSVSPGSGTIGTTVTISGTGFGANPGAVTFNGSAAAPSSWNAGSITVTVPAGATSGNVVVTAGGVPSVGYNFIVITTAPLNTSRFQHSATLLNNGTVLVAGGVTCSPSGSCTYLSSAELYNPASVTSTNTGSLVTPRAAPAVLLPNGNVLIAGGSTCDNFGNCFSLGNAELYNTATGTFSIVGNMQAARDGHTMTLLSNGKVLIAGGETCVPGSGGGRGSKNFRPSLFDGAQLIEANFTPVTNSVSCTALSSAEIYDPQAGTFTLTGSLNVARYHSAAAQLANGHVLIVGGSNEYSPLSYAEIYDPTGATFTMSSSTLQTARTLPAVTLLNSGLVLVSGGSICESPTCPINTAELYDPVADAFQYTSGTMNASRVNHTAVLLGNGQVLLTGGSNSCGGNSCTSDATTELYDPTAGSFTTSQPLANARSGHTATLLSNGSVLLAGGLANGSTIASVETYQPSSFAPAGLVSIAITPGTTSIFVGAVQPFVATGTFGDGTTQILQSASWNSASPAIATVSNAAGSVGFAQGQAIGTTTISATVGTVSGSTTLTVQPPVQSSGFTTSAPMGSSLYAHTATRLTSGQVLIAGGMSPAGVVNTAQLYNPANQSFAAAGAMNVARWLHTATLLNDGTLLIAGGSDLTNRETLDSAEIYNPATGAFTLLASTLNTARVGHTATLLNNGQVLIVGGYDPQFGLIADAELYNPVTQTFTDLGDTSVPRYHHTATILKSGQVLIAGGETDSTPSGAYNVAELFDPPSLTFIPVSVPMNSAREGHAALLMSNGQVLLTGGNDPGTGPLNTAEIYDPVSDVFIAATGIMTTPRVSHVMTLLNGGQVLMVGGMSGVSGTALSSTETFNPQSQLFTAAGSMASVREFQTDTLLNDGTVLIVGGTDGTNIFNSAELYMTSQLTGLTAISVTPAGSSIGAGAQQLFAATGTFSDGSTQSLASVLWNSSNPGIAGIGNDATNSGAAATAAQGTTTVTASAAGIGGSTTLTITTPVLVSIQLSPQSVNIGQGATQQFTATGVYTDGSTQDLTTSATWSSSTSVVATINNSGLAAGLFEGVSTIQASFGSVSASTNLNVTSAALVSFTVSPASATIALGTAQQYQAMGTFSDGSAQNVSGLVAWSSASATVASVSGTGLAQSTGQGSTTVTATFEALTSSAQLTVGPPNLASISVTPSGGLTTGSVQQLTATGIYTDGSTQNLTSSSSWASNNPAVVSISSTGLANASSAGEATITATAGTTSGTAVLIVTATTTQSSLNTSRFQHNATTLASGKILVAGGISCPTAGNCTYLNSAEIYDPTASSFTNTGAMAQARSAPAVLLQNGNLLIAGGYNCDSSGNCMSLASAEIYRPSAGTFISAGTMTAARSGHTMTLLPNGTVLIAGGQTCITATLCTALSSAEIYDPVAGTFTATTVGMSAARFGASAVALSSGSVLIVGGFDGSNLPAAAELYMPSQNAFMYNGPKLNTPRFNATVTPLNNGQILVAGGSTCALPGCPTSAAEVYDPVANTFTTTSVGMNVPRFSHTATLLTNGQVVIAGGFSSCSSSCTSEASTEVFDPVAGTFSPSQSLGNAVAGQSATLTANANVLLIGGVSAQVTTAADEWYQPASLTPAGLVSIAVTPASGVLIPGQTQQLVATGTFTGGSTQTLQSVLWTSSNPAAAFVNTSPDSNGVVNAQTAGSTTITANAGGVGGSASITVQSLVSLTISPANPTIPVGGAQQLTASGTFTDSSTQDLTSTVTWSSSSNSTVYVGNGGGQIPSGYAMAANAGTATITATMGTTQATTSVTVQALAQAPNPPVINSASPNPATGGTQVTISGSGFGTTQGGGTVWLGSTYGIVNTWSDTQIVATVSPIAQSGTVQVRQGGQSSNSLPFSINTPLISALSPYSGVAGTQVTIYGANFGATQGSGQVWLGTSVAIVQSWSDSQIIANVAAGSTTGSARVLQNSVLSNAVPFTVNSLQVTGVSPNSGTPGSVVTISGNGFGPAQGTGVAWLGSTSAEIIGWSNTKIVAVVGANAVSGVARVQQNGTWSNTVPFTVPVQIGSGQPVTIVPGMLSLVVGQTQTIEALNSSGQTVTGLTWVSSNPLVVSLSTDDPPILTAVSPGHASISAGNGSADVVVYPGNALPAGITIWSNPGDGSGVTSIVPAIPSATGLADVFALNYDCNVQAITSDGRVAWTANIGTSTTLTINNNQSTTSTACNQFYPDFQGGLVVMSQTTTQSEATGIVTTAYVQKFDGMTGQAYPAYNLSSPTFNQAPQTVLHTSPTIFILDGGSVIGLDPGTGTPKFQIQPDQSTLTGSGTNCVQGDGTGINLNFIKPFSYSYTPPVAWLSAPVVAGDGNFYVPYSYYEETGTAQAGPPYEYEPCTWTVGTSSGVSANHYRVLRVGPNGDFSKIVLTDTNGSSYYNVASDGSWTQIVSESGFAAGNIGGLITNADQGVMLS